jgi:Tfp pilus assembly protein PilF
MYEQALQSFQNALNIDPNSVVAHINMANVYLALGEVDKSIEHNSKAVEISPEFAMAHNNLAVGYYHKGDLDSARKHVQEAMRLGYTVHPGFRKELEG